MKQQDESQTYLIGFFSSLLLHLIGAVVAIFVLETNAANAHRPADVFSVTLEGGAVLGGISQAPRDLAPQKAPPAGSRPALPAQAATKAQSVQTKKDITGPTVVDDVAKKQEEERKKKLAEQQKKDAELKKKDAELKKKRALEEADKKKKLELEQKKQQDLAAKQKADAQKRKEQEAATQAERAAAEKKAREEALSQAISRASQSAGGSTYSGESADAGGTGFGAARLGGEGMGGGTLQSLEFVAYRNELERHIKSGWHWFSRSVELEAQVLITILPSGAIQDANIVSGSGNRNFDDSVLRAVYKASPVPAAPERVYEHFRSVRITFNSHQ